MRTITLGSRGIMAEERNYLAEALAILRGDTLLHPEVAHLIALDESRQYWRLAALGTPAKAQTRIGGRP